QSIMGYGRSLVVPDDWTKRGNQHECLTDKFVDTTPVKCDSLDAILAKLHACITKNPGGVQHVVDNERPHGVQFEISLGPGESHSVVLSDDLNADHHHRFFLSRVHFPGHHRTARR